MGGEVIPPAELTDTAITVNSVCGTVDGTASKSANCNKQGRFLTIQVTDPTITQLFVRNIKVKVDSPKC